MASQQKIQRWGSFQDIQYAVKKNAEKIYRVNPDSIVLAVPSFWGLPALDYSGKRNNGINSLAQYQDGSLDFANSAAKINFGEGNGDFDFGNGEFSCFVRFKRHAISNVYETVLSKWDAGFPSSYWLRIADTNIIYVGHRTEAEGRWYVWSTGTIGLGWHNIVVQRNLSSEQYEIYINGEPDFYVESGQISYSDDFSNNANLVVGCATSGAENFNGAIETIYVSRDAFHNADQIDKINEQPLALYQRVSRPIYSFPTVVNIDETNKLISIISTVSATDFQAYKDLQKLIEIVSTIQGSDLQAYKDLQKLIEIVSTIQGSDLQAYKDLQKLIEISSVITASDIQAYKETDKQVFITSTILATDIQGFIEDLLIAITSTVSETDLLSYNERNRTIPIAATISVSNLQTYKDIVNILIASTIAGTDVQAYKDLNLQIPITSTISSTDIQGFIEKLLIGITTTVSETDLLSYNERNRTIPIAATISVAGIQAYKDALSIQITSSFTASDFQFYVDQGIVSIVCTISASDAMSGLASAHVRVAFTVVPRTKEFTVVPRTKEFTVV